MNKATAIAAAPQVTNRQNKSLGIAAFHDDDFEVTDGWVTLKANEVDLDDLSNFHSRSLFGRTTNSAVMKLIHMQT